VSLLEEMDCEKSRNEFVTSVDINAKGDASKANRITNYTIFFAPKKSKTLQSPTVVHAM
jgi:hypothetical protein